MCHLNLQLVVHWMEHFNPLLAPLHLMDHLNLQPALLVDHFQLQSDFQTALVRHLNHQSLR